MQTCRTPIAIGIVETVAWVRPRPDQQEGSGVPMGETQGKRLAKEGQEVGAWDSRRWASPLGGVGVLPPASHLGEWESVEGAETPPGFPSVGFPLQVPPSCQRLALDLSRERTSACCPRERALKSMSSHTPPVFRSSRALRIRPMFESSPSGWSFNRPVGEAMFIRKRLNVLAGGVDCANTQPHLRGDGTHGGPAAPHAPDALDVLG